MDSGSAHDLQYPQYNRALTMRAPTRWFYYLTWVSAPLVAGLFFWLASSVSANYYIGAVLIPAALIAVARFWIRPMAFTRVFVTNTGLAFELDGATTNLQFHQVERVQLNLPAFLAGGYRLVLRDGRKFRISPFLERGDYVLDALTIAHPTLLRADRAFAFRRNIIVADHVLARLEATLANWQALLLMQLGLPAVVTLGVAVTLNADLGIDLLLIFCSIGILNGILTGTIWIVSEALLIRNKNAELSENPLNPLRDLNRERSGKRTWRLFHSLVLALSAAWMWL